MNILVVGSGVIGGYLTHILYVHGHVVSLVARGAWKQQLEQTGLVIQHTLQRVTTVDRPKILGACEGQHYDAVFVSMQYQQMWSVLDSIALCNTELVVLVGNNVEAYKMETYLSEHSTHTKTILFAFQGTAGRREGGKIISIHMKNHGMTYGTLHGFPDCTVQKKMQALLGGRSYPLRICKDMHAWYISHLALIVPVCFVCYAHDCNLKKATSKERSLLLQAAREGYSLIEKSGMEVLPEDSKQVFDIIWRRWLFSCMIFILCKTFIGQLSASDHAKAATTEMAEFYFWFQKFKDQHKDVPMPAWEALERGMKEPYIMVRR